MAATEYRIIYCRECERVIGRYNRKYYTDERIGEVIRSQHNSHVREGHDIELRISCGD